MMGNLVAVVFFERQLALNSDGEVWKMSWDSQ
jgi:hypothetical protein